MASGGNRQPRNPAAVSNPGSGRRTDGGAGSKSQPLRVASGGAYGERQAAEAQQQAAPMPTSGTPGPPSGGAAPQGVGPAGGVFGATERPGEPPTAGMMPRGQAVAQAPEEALRIMYSRFPHPTIARLLSVNERERNGR
jgi:hypothetical protein